MIRFIKITLLLILTAIAIIPIAAGFIYAFLFGSFMVGSDFLKNFLNWIRDY